MILKTCSSCNLQRPLWKSIPKLCKPCAGKTVKTINPVKKQTKTNENKSIPDLIKLAVIVFHKWIKRRDSHDGAYYCISCDTYGNSKDAHAGHYLNAGNNSPVKFHEHNVNLQCEDCNINKMGNVANYRIALVNKIGLTEVEQIEQEAKREFKWCKIELLEIISKYKNQKL